MEQTKHMALIFDDLDTKLKNYYGFKYRNLTILAIRYDGVDKKMVGIFDLRFRNGPLSAEQLEIQLFDKLLAPWRPTDLNLAVKSPISKDDLNFEVGSNWEKTGPHTKVWIKPGFIAAIKYTFWVCLCACGKKNFVHFSKVKGNQESFFVYLSSLGIDDDFHLQATIRI